MTVAWERSLWRAWQTLVVLVVCGVIAAPIWAIVNGIENWQNGIYAGMHFVDAKRVARDVLIGTYGMKFVNGMQFAVPPVVNTRTRSVLNDGQIRVFHIIGPKGVRYCVTTWGPENDNWIFAGGHKWGDGTGINVQAHYLLKKGCSF